MPSEIEIHGACDARFAPVREAFARSFRESDEIGAGVAIAVDGRSSSTSGPATRTSRARSPGSATRS